MKLSELPVGQWCQTREGVRQIVLHSVGPPAKALLATDPLTSFGGSWFPADTEVQAVELCPWETLSVLREVVNAADKDNKYQCHPFTVERARRILTQAEAMR